MPKALSFQNITSGVLCLCAVVITGLVVRREFSERPAEIEAREIQDWTRLLEDGRWLGDPAAPIRIVEFSDFQCPACARARDRLAQLRQQYGGQFAVVYRHYPLEKVHPHARAAAIAAECAAEQGRSQAYHDLLFERQDEIGSIAWEELASQAGVGDLDAFRSCLEAPSSARRVERELAVGDSLGINAVLAFIVDGRLATGSAGMALVQSVLSGRAGFPRGRAIRP